MAEIDRRSHGNDRTGSEFVEKTIERGDAARNRAASRRLITCRNYMSFDDQHSAHRFVAAVEPGLHEHVERYLRNGDLV